MADVSLGRVVGRSRLHADAQPDEPVEFGNGLRRRLETAGTIGRDQTVMLRLALEQNLLAAVPELAGWRGGSSGRMRVPDVPFATLVYHARLLPAERLEEVLAEARRRNEPVGTILVQEGLLTQRQVDRLLAEQRGLAYISVREVALDERLAGVLPERTARGFNALPVGYLEGAAVIAVSDPTDDVAMNSIANQIGERIRFVAAEREEITAALTRLYASCEVAA